MELDTTEFRSMANWNRLASASKEAANEGFTQHRRGILNRNLVPAMEMPVMSAYCSVTWVSATVGLPLPLVLANDCSDCCRTAFSKS
jgi:hypothetical protein